MYYSKYNIFVNLYKYPEYLILQNIFHGKASLFPKKMADRIKKYSENSSTIHLSKYENDLLLEKGFIYQTQEEENKLIQDLYQEFLKTLLPINPTRQYQILLTYDCNLHCLYCFQKKIKGKTLMNWDKLQAVFSIICDIERKNEKEIQKRSLSTRVPLISIVGGEPLRNIPEHQYLVREIIAFCKKNRFNYAITTNGLELDTYLLLFYKQNYLPRDVQITLDGTKEFHDKRRITVGGQGSFDDIVNSINVTLEAGIHISLRINLDSMNLQSIDRLADFIVRQGWNNAENFSAYLAPITDHSQVNQNYKWLVKDATIIQMIVKAFQRRPELENIFTLKNFRGYSYVKRIAEKDGFPIPTFWRCEAVLGQMIFDPLGNVFTCFEGAGNFEAKVGEYFPKLHIEKKRIASWTELNSVTNRYCEECKYRFVCASGCPWHIVRHKKTECLPIEEEIYLAWNYYAPKVLKNLQIDDNL